MDKSAKIYVAGHQGLVGSALVRKLLADGYNNLLLCSHRELDLIDQQAVNEFFQREKPEYVFLAAAKVGGIGANAQYPAMFIYDNIMMEANIIHAAYQNKVKKLLFLGSSCMPQSIEEEALIPGR